MTNFYFFSSLCPDTPAFDVALQEVGVEYEAIDITQSMSNLKRFLQMRDTADAYASRRGTASVGVPVLVTANGEYLFSPEALNSRFGQR